jgi:glycosyltransferase involved in cell wall biosynthesis
MMTVLLATRNRAQILKDVLASFCDLQAPASGWKLVVVDNGSTDGTSRILSSFADRLPLHAAVEPRMGKNKALNLGLNLIEGDLAVFTDDDVFPRSDWLVQLRQAADTHPAYSMFGGAILPRWETAPPSWVHWIEKGPVFTLTDSSFKDGTIDPWLVFGPNMMIRTSVFVGGVKFDPSIGPQGTSYPMGSETELLLRLSAQGQKACHVSGAVVEHLIRTPQLQKSWVARRGVRYGRGYYRMFVAEHLIREGKLLLGVPRHLLRDLPKEALSICAAALCMNHEAAFRARWRLNIFRGYLVQALADAKGRRGARSNAPSCDQVTAPGGVSVADPSKLPTRHS